MDIFLTGGTGFIGSYVTKVLSDAGHRITVLARNPDKVPALHNLPHVTIIAGLLTDFGIIDEHLKGKDACIHIALGWGDMGTSMLKNDTFPSVFLFECAARSGVSHFIYTSSTAAVGNTPPQKEKSAEPPPTDYYGATKSSSEGYLYAVSYQYPMRCNIIRPGYTFGNPVIKGASMEPDGRFGNIVEKIKSGNPVEVTHYDGTQFIWAGDLARVYGAVLESDVSRKCYFALGKSYVTWENIANEVKQMLGSSSTIILNDKGYDPVPPLFDVSPMKKDFGLEFRNWDRICEHLKYLVKNVD